MNETSSSRLVDVLLDGDLEKAKLNKITETIIGSAYNTSDQLGTGFLEKVYENSLLVEHRKQGLTAEQQKPIEVRYDETVAGSFFADLLVEGIVLAELKHATGIDPAHKAQCLNCLKATRLKICILVNFGKPRIEIKRIIN